MNADAWSHTRIRNINDYRSLAILVTLNAKPMLMPTCLAKQSVAMCDIYATVMLCEALSCKSVHQDSCLPATAVEVRCAGQQNMATHE